MQTTPGLARILALGSIVSACAAPPSPGEAEAVGASTYVYPARSDHWGCDTDTTPLLGFAVSSFGDHGQCCDVHDACLAGVAGCQGDFAHWEIAAECAAGTRVAGCDDPCIQCHLNVVGCLTGPATGQSQCVAFGNCGDARRADNAFGCTNDQICQVQSGNQFIRCNPDNGQCEAPSLPDCPPPGCYNAFEGVCHQPDSCGPGRVLDAGSCSCVVGTPSCTPCLGQSCGTDLACGTGQSCGSCPSDYTCNSSGSCEHVDTCLSFCGNGVCECNEPDYCASDCGGGGGGGGDCPVDCDWVCGGTGLCSNGSCLCGT